LAYSVLYALMVFQWPRYSTVAARQGGSVYCGPSFLLVSYVELCLNDPQVSAMHCAVGLTEDVVRLCDLDSANGTYVNDERIQAIDLEHLGEFRIGSMVVISRKHSA